MSNTQLLTPPSSSPATQPASIQMPAPAPTPRRHRRTNRTTQTGDNQVEFQHHYQQQQSNNFTEIEMDYEPQPATQNVCMCAENPGKPVSPMHQLWEAKIKGPAEAKKKRRRSDKHVEMCVRMLERLELEPKQQEEEGWTEGQDCETRG